MVVCICILLVKYLQDFPGELPQYSDCYDNYSKGGVWLFCFVVIILIWTKVFILSNTNKI